MTMGSESPSSTVMSGPSYIRTSIKFILHTWLSNVVYEFLGLGKILAASHKLKCTWYFKASMRNMFGEIPQTSSFRHHVFFILQEYEANAGCLLRQAPCSVKAKLFFDNKLMSNTKKTVTSHRYIIHTC